MIIRRQPDSDLLLLYTPGYLPTIQQALHGDSTTFSPAHEDSEANAYVYRVMHARKYTM